MANLPSQIAPLTNNDKTKIIYPITKALAVNMENGSSVEQAVNDLNSKTTAVYYKGLYTDANQAYADSPDKSNCRFLLNASGQNSPDSTTAWMIDQFRSTAAYGYQVARRTNDVKVYQRFLAGAWSNWVLQPQRSEVDTLKNYLVQPGTIADANTMFTEAGNRTIITRVINANGSNVPTSTGNWVITQYRDSANYGYQIAQHTDNTDIYYRRIYAGAWYSWVKLPAREEITDLNATKTVIATFSNVAIADNADTTIDVSSYLPSGYGLYSVNALVKTSGGGYYQLPWLDMPNSKTLYVFSLSNSQVTLKNVGTGWGTCTVYLTLFYGRQ